MPVQFEISAVRRLLASPRGRKSLIVADAIVGEGQYCNQPAVRQRNNPTCQNSLGRPRLSGLRPPSAGSKPRVPRQARDVEPVETACRNGPLSGLARNWSDSVGLTFINRPKSAGAVRNPQTRTARCPSSKRGASRLVKRAICTWRMYGNTAAGALRMRSRRKATKHS